MGCNHGNLCTLTNRNGEPAEKVTGRGGFHSLHDRGKVFARCQKRRRGGGFGGGGILSDVAGEFARFSFPSLRPGERGISKLTRRRLGRYVY